MLLAGVEEKDEEEPKLSGVYEEPPEYDEPEMLNGLEYTGSVFMALARFEPKVRDAWFCALVGVETDVFGAEAPWVVADAPPMIAALLAAAEEFRDDDEDDLAILTWL
jgi:hypothetical protein